MRFEFLFLGKTKESYLAAGIDDFQHRLNRYGQVEIRTLKEKHQAGERQEKIITEEGKLLLERVSRPGLLVALDRTGRELDSEALAELLGKWEEQGHRSVSFLVGGPLGLAPAVLEAADLVLSLSRLTFTHEMARLLLLEQLYRAQTIRAGTGYHK